MSFEEKQNKKYLSLSDNKMSYLKEQATLDFQKLNIFASISNRLKNNQAIDSGLSFYTNFLYSVPKLKDELQFMAKP